MSKSILISYKFCQGPCKFTVQILLENLISLTITAKILLKNNVNFIDYKNGLLKVCRGKS